MATAAAQKAASLSDAAGAASGSRRRLMQNKLAELEQHLLMKQAARAERAERRRKLKESYAPGERPGSEESIRKQKKRKLILTDDMYDPVTQMYAPVTDFGASSPFKTNMNIELEAGASVEVTVDEVTRPVVGNRVAIRKFNKLVTFKVTKGPGLLTTGFRVWTDDGDVLSGISDFKCLPEPFPNWDKISTNVQQWPGAIPVVSEGISNGAFKIWTMNTADDVIYCRVNINLQQLEITTDALYQVYMDGAIAVPPVHPDDRFGIPNLGCVEDRGGHTLAVVVVDHVVGVEECRFHCKNMKYSFMGLQQLDAATGSARCLCGERWGSMGVLPRSQCSYRCSDGSPCGGTDATSIYSVKWTEGDSGYFFPTDPPIVVDNHVVSISVRAEVTGYSISQAWGRPVTTSSNVVGKPGAFAVDKDMDTCFESGAEAKPYLMIDLGAQSHISEVLIARPFGARRTRARLSNTTNPADWHICGVIGYDSKHYHCNDKLGRYLIIDAVPAPADYKRPLKVCQVEVFNSVTQPSVAMRTTDGIFSSSTDRFSCSYAVGLGWQRLDFDPIVDLWPPITSVGTTPDGAAKLVSDGPRLGMAQIFCRNLVSPTAAEELMEARQQIDMQLSAVLSADMAAYSNAQTSQLPMMTRSSTESSQTIVNELDEQVTAVGAYASITTFDHEPPAFSFEVQPMIYINCDEFKPPCDDLTAYDSDGDVAQMYFSEVEILFNLWLRTWKALDDDDNVALLTQYVFVLDDSPPLLSSEPQDQYRECDLHCAETIEPPFVFAVDNCDEFVALHLDIENFDSDVSNSGDNRIIKSQVNHWSTTDRAGNYAEHFQTVFTWDTTPPKFSRKSVLLDMPEPEQTLECDAYSSMDLLDMETDPLDIQVYDACTIDIAMTYDSEILSSTCVNEYVRRHKWSATDDVGQETVLESVITMTDPYPPAILAIDTSKQCIWPPNDKWVAYPDISLSVTAADACVTPTIEVVGCNSTATTPDSTSNGAFEEGCAYDADTDTLYLQASLTEYTNGAKIDRLYRVLFDVSDGCNVVRAQRTFRASIDRVIGEECVAGEFDNPPV